MSRSQGSCFHGDLKIISSVLPSFIKSLLLPRHWARRSFTSWLITDSIVEFFTWIQEITIICKIMHYWLWKNTVQVVDIHKRCKGPSVDIAKHLIKYFLHQRCTHLHADIISDLQGKITPSYLLVQKYQYCNKVMSNNKFFTCLMFSSVKLQVLHWLTML